MYKLDKISVIIIGKNEENTILESIQAVKAALNNSSIEKSEIVYVDSHSSDDSLLILKKEKNIKIIKIVDGFTSAALGRYLGLNYSSFENVLFLDGDMLLQHDFLRGIAPFFIKYGAVTAQVDNIYSTRHEVINIFNIDKEGPIQRLGGFLLISKTILKDNNFRPILKDEEEIDFYSQFYKFNKVYGIPIKGVKHIDKKRSLWNKLQYHLNPNHHFGWILGLYFAIKENNKSYIILVLPYLANIVGAIGFWGIFINKSMIWVWLFSLPFGWSIGSSIITTILLPFRLVLAVLFLSRWPKNIKYNIEGKEVSTNISN